METLCSKNMILSPESTLLQGRLPREEGAGDRGGEGGREGGKGKEGRGVKGRERGRRRKRTKKGKEDRRYGGSH